MDISFEEFLNNVDIKRGDKIAFNCEKCGKSYTCFGRIFKSKKKRFGKYFKLCSTCLKNKFNAKVKFKDIIKYGIPKGASNSDVIVTCVVCNEEKRICIAKALKYRKHKEELCNKCYFKKHVYGSEEWLEKNRKAQLIVQGTPSQKLKNAIGVSNSWKNDPSRRTRCSEQMKDRMKDPVFRELALKNLSSYEDKLKKTLFVGRSSGTHNGIFYQSILELAAILYFLEMGKNVKRCEFYIDYMLDGKPRKYYPDFVVENELIEIKSTRFLEYHEKYKKSFLAKNSAAEAYCLANNMSYKVLDLTSGYGNIYRKAQRLHAQNKKNISN